MDRCGVQSHFPLMGVFHSRLRWILCQSLEKAFSDRILDKRLFKKVCQCFVYVCVWVAVGWGVPERNFLHDVLCQQH